MYLGAANGGSGWIDCQIVIDFRLALVHLCEIEMADDSDVITFNFPQGDQNEDAILAPKENESGEPVVMTNKSSHMCDRDFNLKLDERCESMLEMVDSRMSRLERLFQKNCQF